MCAETTTDLTAAYRNSHLDADKALGCPVALAYFIKAFAGLDEAERADWVAAYDAAHRYELGSLALSLGAGGDFMFLMALDMAEIENDELDIVFNEINASLEGTDFANAEYREGYQAQHSKKLAQMMARGDADDSDANMINQLMALLSA